jgi:protoporphyrinogen oxidase
VQAFYGNEDLPTQAYGAFRDWILAKLGEGIGKHFMFPYNEKLWTVPTEDLTCGWLSEYVPRPTLQEVFDGAFRDQTKGFGYNATFWYPKHGGIQALSDALAGKAGPIRFGEEVERVLSDHRAVRLASGKTIAYERLVSTIPLDQLVDRLDVQVPADVREARRMLVHNSLLIVNLGVRGEGLTDKHWIYLPEMKFTPYRVGVYSNFSSAMAPPGTTSYYVEIAYRKEWNVDKQRLAEKAVSDLIEIGLVPQRRDIIVRDVRDVECGYVIYDRNYERCRTAIMEYLRSNGIISIGRYGGWEYSGMEEAMASGSTSIASMGAGCES